MTISKNVFKKKIARSCIKSSTYTDPASITWKALRIRDIQNPLELRLCVIYILRSILRRPPPQDGARAHLRAAKPLKDAQTYPDLAKGSSHPGRAVRQDPYDVGLSHSVKIWAKSKRRALNGVPIHRESKIRNRGFGWAFFKSRFRPGWVKNVN